MNIMFDIETASTRSNAVILSIGAVKFDENFVVQEKFYANIDPKSCVDLGLHVDKDTINWWKQNTEAYKQLLTNRKPVDEAIKSFIDFCGDPKSTVFWCNGMNFDFPIVEWCVLELGMQPPWKYWNMRDARTIYALAGVNTKTNRTGTYHNALDDCITQVEFLKQAYN